MKYLDEFRNPKIAHALAMRIAQEVRPTCQYRFMEFCGGHTHTIFRYSIQSLLPSNIDLVHGPGCPVCVLPIGKIDNAIELAHKKNVIVCTYGDTMRIPGSEGLTLLKAKARGCDVRMVYSTLDALSIAQQNPGKEVIFFAIGFETTAPATGVALKKANILGLDNFSIFCNHLVTPSAIQNILESPDVRELGKISLHGFLGPAHVSTIIGTQPYEYFAQEYRKPVVIAGFEPLDILQAIWLLVRQVNEKRAEVENQYTRAVTREGNRKAKSIVAEFFELRKFFEWRGLGIIPYSALKLKKGYEKFDAEKKFEIKEKPVKENKACQCPAVIRGMKKPTDCKLFRTVCTPENPIGSCMVSSEGTCAAYYLYVHN